MDERVTNEGEHDVNTRPRPDNGRRSALSILTLVIGLMLVVIQPAGANHGEPLTGEGTADSGTEDIKTSPANPDPEPPLCLEVLSSKYTFSIDSGRFEGHDTSGNLVVYEGPATVTLNTEDTYYIAPEGTYTNRLPNGVCDPASFAKPITITATVEGSLGAGSIDCGPDTSTTPPDGYFRIETQQFFDWKGDCTVVGNVVNSGTSGTTPGTTDHDFDGTIIPCLPFDPTCTAPDLSGTYTYEG